MISIIVKDEEILSVVRITLDENGSWYEITCGVYGAFMHTAFADSREEALSKYAAMKDELTKFMGRETTQNEEFEFYKAFADKY